jgi:hypothetical protein
LGSGCRRGGSCRNPVVNPKDSDVAPLYAGIGAHHIAVSITSRSEWLNRLAAASAPKTLRQRLLPRSSVKRDKRCEAHLLRASAPWPAPSSATLSQGARRRKSDPLQIDHSSNCAPGDADNTTPLGATLFYVAQVRNKSQSPICLRNKKPDRQTPNSIRQFVFVQPLPR